MNKDDQDWLDALAGKPAPGADPETARRAAALRKTLLDIRKEGLADESPDDGLDRLLFRLRREGLLEKEKNHWLLQFPVAFAMAASVLIAVGFGWLMKADRDRPYEESTGSAMFGVPYSTGGASAPQTLYADAPGDLATSLTQEFSAAGIALRQSDGGDSIRLEGELPENLSADALQLIGRYRLSIPDGRKLIIEIRRQAAQ